MERSGEVKGGNELVVYMIKHVYEILKDIYLYKIDIY